jgi:hypothetical protein
MNCPQCKNRNIDTGWDSKKGERVLMCLDCDWSVPLSEIGEALELKRLLDSIPDNCCLEHSEGWEHGYEWFVIARHGGLAEHGIGMGKTPLDALKGAADKNWRIGEPAEGEVGE